MTDAEYKDVHDKATLYILNYKIAHKYISLEDPDELDAFITHALAEWVTGVVADLVFSEICSHIEGEPMHHLMKNKVLVYKGIELERYITLGDVVKLQEVKATLMAYYNQQAEAKKP